MQEVLLLASYEISKGLIAILLVFNFPNSYTYLLVPVGDFLTSLFTFFSFPTILLFLLVFADNFSHSVSHLLGFVSFPISSGSSY